jgi:hypothetical protein
MLQNRLTSASRTPLLSDSNVKMAASSRKTSYDRYILKTKILDTILGKP